MYNDEVLALIAKLDDDDMSVRLNALRQLNEAEREGIFSFPEAGTDVNSHIHTKYSFSPYTPAAAVFRSKEAGLATTGIMDHDSVDGSREFSEAGRILGIATTQGTEFRVSLKGTFLENSRVNNPDQNGVAYIAFHGIPDSSLEEMKGFLAPLREARLLRNRKMVDNLNALINREELYLDFDKDVLSESYFAKGGGMTERHLLHALAKKMIAFKGKGPALTAFLEKGLGLPVSDSLRQNLDNPDNPYCDYDLLGLFKAYYVSSFYVEATDECPPIKEAVDFANKHGIVVAYPYLGDVTASVTGDKASQTFEDAYLDELLPFLKDLGIKALTYMPSRNTTAQMERLMGLCEEHGFFQISGEDINQPRQKFICMAMRDPMFAHLTDAAWALIGHERAASEDLSKGIFSEETMAAMPALKDRIEYFKNLALKQN